MKTVGWPTAVIAVLTIAVLAVRCFGVVLDFHDAVFYPFEIDYGEGIVWQQAASFMVGSAYRPLTAFPFIVFHYPPVYYGVVWLFSWAFADLLAAGRAVSVCASLCIAASVAMTVWGFGTSQRRMWRAAVAAVAALTVLGSGNVWTWGLLMRVDMVAIALSFLGLLVAHRSNGRFGWLVVALVLCTAAVYTKQVQVSAGSAIFATALLLRTKPALSAGAIAGLVGLSAFLVLQMQTGGGFFQNIVLANINPFSWSYLELVVWEERRDLAILVVGLGAAIVCVARIGPVHSLRRRMRADSLVASRVLATLHYGACGLTLVTAAKEGSNVNYFIEFLVSGVVLAGFAAFDAIQAGRPRWLNYGLVALGLGTTLMPWRGMPAYALVHDSAAQWALVDQLRTLPAPVSSENMTLLMRAGQPVVYEPAIVRHLALTGSWDEQPLLDMIRARRFAVMITIDPALRFTSLRTPAADAAMRESYPVVTVDAPGLWVHRPQ